jgi:hypothetical protein
MHEADKLITMLRSRLGEHGYNEFAEVPLGGGDSAAVITAANRSLGRLACAVVRIPNAWGSNGYLAGLAQRIRSSLTKRLAPFPWPRRLGTYTVLLCERDRFDELRRKKDVFVDSGKLHVNVMLGAVLVDVETFRASSENVWGLVGNGELFGQIRDVVTSWCIEAALASCPDDPPRPQRHWALRESRRRGAYPRESIV